AEEDAIAVEQWRGLAGAREPARPARLPGRRVERPDAPGSAAVRAREDRGVDGFGVHRGGGGRQLAELARPNAVAVALVGDVERAAVGQLVDAVAVDDRRELEQRARAVCPQLFEGRAHL